MTDAELKRIARQFRRGILGKRPSAQMCMAVSASLQGVLSALYGVDTVLEEIQLRDMNHVFLRLADGRILDATADQFGLDAVYLGDLPDAYRP